MIEAAVIGLRWAQYVAAVAALGLPLFQIHGPRGGVFPGASVAAAAVLAVSALGGLVAQTAMMAGGWAAALDPAALAYVVQSTGLGMAHVARAGLAVLGGLLLMAGRGEGATRVAAIIVLAAAVASFAWSGHGASTEGGYGIVHLTSDILHALAAAVWIGALAGFMVRLARPRPEDTAATARALADFAAVGTGAVAILVVTGLINGVFLIGPEALTRTPATVWGALLVGKLVMFTAMLALAAHNRFTLTPSLRRAVDVRQGVKSAMARLRLSIGLEMLAGVALLGLVAAMGVQPPPASM